VAHKHRRFTIGKGKVVPALNQAPCHEDDWWSGGIAPRILYVALDTDERSASRHGRFAPGTHWTGGWTRWRRESSLPLPTIEPRSPSPQHSHCTDRAIVLLLYFTANKVSVLLLLLVTLWNEL